MSCYSMNITTYTSEIRTIREKDPEFYIRDKYSVAPRAAIEISQSCPERDAQMILYYIQKGWLKSIAMLTEQEMISLGLVNK